MKQPSHHADVLTAEQAFLFDVVSLFLDLALSVLYRPRQNFTGKAGDLVRLNPNLLNPPRKRI